MDDCSLCGNRLPPEGGAILFTDARGVPFEICGKCEGAVGQARDTADEAAAEDALKYISDCAENIEYRDTFETLMGLLRSEPPEDEPEGEVREGENAALPEDEESDTDGVDNAEDAVELIGEVTPGAGKAKKRKFWPAVIVVLILGLLVLAYLLGGFHIG